MPVDSGIVPEWVATEDPPLGFSDLRSPDLIHTVRLTHAQSKDNRVARAKSLT